ncbi:hypothetical protein [Brevundimonas sp. PAMC22021]|uniref:hypothetical protein n=1 Tax=Brevundimonas sp. PAMC22021 TaxID=2861285 RepID=UPI001C62721A|nr:hypothetical protein [Brevundimonas sp. PAMC22021]QYF86469.1 hypothetical protein KY493_11630 [Brevundimonas sp. PAMC22021]
MKSTVRPMLVIAGLAMLAACASTGGPNRYQAEYDRLEADCRARDGILQPTGSQSAQPARDYVCRITGGASPLTDR